MKRALVPAALAALLAVSAADAAAKPKFESKVVTTEIRGHAVDVEVDIAGAEKLYLVVTDGGNGFACDWADWVEPRLVAADGSEKKLTDLKWKNAKAEWGQVRVGKNADGGDLRIDGKEVEYGIGTHANSVIEYELPQGYAKFKARGGLDNGGTSQSGGQATSVTFAVYLDEAPQQIASRPAGGGDAGQRVPEKALEGLDVAEGLEATLFAAEPMLLSPSDIDVDHLGRVWVCEVVNYRGRNNSRPEGDRILILEDSDGDGTADKQTVFYQGRDIDSALGICVLGNKVIVSVSPNVFVFTDENGDGKADRKDLLFTKTGQPQHDHSAHAFVFGPDGKLYWNFGNTGQSVHDKDGKPVVDVAGNQVVANGQPYREGMVFRCNLDGSEFETLGWNFRNNYEVAVDSFGGLWQSDNDDDGNRGVRINYVMPYGNYGYKDEMTGGGWQDKRTNMEEEIPLRHWHLNDPGVVPNLLQTGAGSPTGICVYEGSLLPKTFRGQVIHCDAGPNVVRAYPVEQDGAGYSAKVENIIEGSRDKWFRPSDVCVAPDGSLIVADWYDPGVGGHAMGDLDRGRLFRVAPPRAAYKTPKYDFSTAEGAVEALKSPNLSARYLAWTALHGMGARAEAALRTLAKDENPRFRARAVWLLGKMEGRGERTVGEAVGDENADIRVVGVRLAQQLKRDIIPVVRQLARDKSPQVRAELAIALRHNKAPEAAELWAELALQHDGKDRWYLEALGIGADGQWDRFFEAWHAKAGDRWNTPAGRDIVWRSRSEKALPLLAKIVLDPAMGEKERPRYFRAFDFHRPQDPGKVKRPVLVDLALAGPPDVMTLALTHLGNVNVKDSPELAAALKKTLDAARGTPRFVELVQQFNASDRYPELLKVAQEKPGEQVGVEAIRALLAKDQTDLVTKALRGEDPKVALATAEVLGASSDGKALEILSRLMGDAEADAELRRQAVRSMARIRNGAVRLTNLAIDKKLDESLVQTAAAALHAAEWPDVRQRAEKLFPLPASKDSAPLPSIGELVRMKGDVVEGRIVFNGEGTCAKCHKVDGVGKEVGPDLSEIGSKLSRQALYESILFPSAGISHNYETFTLLTVDGTVVSGIVTSRTPEEISLKGADALVRAFKLADVEEIRKSEVSLMPADLQKVMTAKDLVNVVEYLTTLTKKEAAQK